MNEASQTITKLWSSLTQTPIFHRILVNYSVIMVCLGGSYGVNLANAESDWDINIYVADNCAYQRLHERWHLVVDECLVHCYICPVDSIVQSKTGYAAQLIKQYYLKPEQLLWQNPDYITFIGTYFKFQSQLSYIGLLRYRELLRLNQERFTTPDLIKSLYSYFWGAREILGLPISMEYIQWFKRNCARLTELDLQDCYQLTDWVSACLDQKQDSWEDLWQPIYVLLQTTL